MELSELVSYAREKYQIGEQHKWADFPGFSVLSHPRTGKWVALLMRQWDWETGTELQRCDLKCGQDSLREWKKPYLSYPVRMKGKKWISVDFNRETEAEVVFRLFDLAFASGDEREYGYTIVLDSKPAEPEAETVYQETPLPFSGGLRSASGQIHSEMRSERRSGSPQGGPVSYTPGASGQSAPGKVFAEYSDEPAAGLPRDREAPPERLRQMRRLYEYGRESMEAKAKNFYRQGKFMEDYEDDYPWRGDLIRFFPTYHDLTTDQLRGYFSWRTRARKGDFQKIPASAAYIYIYELLNGIGTVSPEDSLQKMKAFEEGFLDTGLGDSRMRENLHRWMMEFSVIRGLPAAVIAQYADRDLLERDGMLAILRSPAEHPDEEIFSTLCRMTGKKTDQSPAVTADPERGMRLFADAWRYAADNYRVKDKDLFSLCFGEQYSRVWRPFANTVYYWKDMPEEFSCTLNECRTYSFKDGVWKVSAYEKLLFDKNRLKSFLHEADLLLRRYLKTGRYLKEKEEDAWAAPLISAVIEEDRRAVIEAARPKVTIDLSGLEQIRRDSLTTQNSLLVGEAEEQNGLSVGEEPEQNSLPAGEEPEQSSQPAEEEAEQNSQPAGEEEKLFADGADLPMERSEEPEIQKPEEPAAQKAAGPDIPLDEVQLRILRELLSGGDGAAVMQAGHLMPSIVADGINEALFDEIGDIVISCDEDRLSLVEDYIEDLEELFGGTLT